MKKYILSGLLLFSAAIALPCDAVNAALNRTFKVHNKDNTNACISNIANSRNLCCNTQTWNGKQPIVEFALNYAHIHANDQYRENAINLLCAVSDAIDREYGYQTGAAHFWYKGFCYLYSPLTLWYLSQAQRKISYKIGELNPWRYYPWEFAKIAIPITLTAITVLYFAAPDKLAAILGQKVIVDAVKAGAGAGGVPGGSVVADAVAGGVPGA